MITNKNQHKKEARRLKYCLKCKKVYEKDSYYKKKEIHYSNMPTYGLDRITCERCINIKMRNVNNEY
tara:strand:+ start:502 stop:702 length:201 start_codon:yes stop_codon:yes gene_type:complete